MHSFVKVIFIGTLLGGAASAFGGNETPASETAPVVEKCEHGVKKNICTRCQPKLKAVFKSKGDWCDEHERAESQCAICHPELIKEGIKP